MLQFSDNIISKVNNVVDTVTKPIQGGQYINVSDILQSTDAYIYFYNLSSVIDEETITFPSTDFTTEKNQEITLYDEDSNYKVTIKYDYTNKKITFTPVKSADGDVSSQLNGEIKYVTGIGTYDVDFSKTNIWLQSNGSSNTTIDGTNSKIKKNITNYIEIIGNCKIREV